MLYTQKLSRCFSLMAVLLLLNEAAALAGYSPPQPPTPTKVTGTTTGVRGGCYGDAPTDLTAIAPLSHVGQSGAQRPKFVWFVPEQEPLDLEFRLYELETTAVSPGADSGVNNKVQKKRVLTQTLASQPGWMKFELPSTMEPLSPSKNYLWSVILHCNPNRPSRSQRIDAELRIQPLNSALTAQLSSMVEPTARAQFLAQEGYWYDAIELLTPSPGETEAIAPAITSARADLLRDLARAEPEAQQNQLLEILRAQE